jgi:hypothetical protein
MKAYQCALAAVALTAAFADPAFAGPRNVAVKSGNGAGNVVNSGNVRAGRGGGNVAIKSGNGVGNTVNSGNLTLRPGVVPHHHHHPHVLPHRPHVGDRGPLVEVGDVNINIAINSGNGIGNVVNSGNVKR